MKQINRVFSKIIPFFSALLLLSAIPQIALAAGSVTLHGKIECIADALGDCTLTTAAKSGVTLSSPVTLELSWLSDLVPSVGESTVTFRSDWGNSMTLTVGNIVLTEDPRPAGTNPPVAHFTDGVLDSFYMYWFEASVGGATGTEWVINIDGDETTGDLTMYLEVRDDSSLTGDWLIGHMAFPETVHSDFNGDQMADILLQNGTSGLMWLFEMSGHSITKSKSVAQINTAVWDIAGMADFNGDTMSDILLRNSNGAMYLYEMNGNTISHQSFITNADSSLKTLGASVEIKGVADFNGDGMADILLCDTATGDYSILQMDGSSITVSGDTFATLNQALWDVASVADFNGDGMADILLKKNDGLIWLYQMNADTITQSNGIAQLNSLSWTVAAGADYNGDGMADILLHNTATGLFWLYQMNGKDIIKSKGIAVLNTVWQVAAGTDFNCDNKADILLRNPTTGLMWLFQMNGDLIEKSKGIAILDPVWDVVK